MGKDWSLNVTIYCSNGFVIGGYDTKQLVMTFMSFVTSKTKAPPFDGYTNTLQAGLSLQNKYINIIMYHKLMVIVSFMFSLQVLLKVG